MVDGRMGDGGWEWDEAHSGDKSLQKSLRSVSSH